MTAAIWDVATGSMSPTGEIKEASVAIGVFPSCVLCIAFCQLYAQADKGKHGHRKRHQNNHCHISNC